MSGTTTAMGRCVIYHHVYKYKKYNKNKKNLSVNKAFLITMVRGPRVPDLRLVHSKRTTSISLLLHGNKADSPSRTYCASIKMFPRFRWLLHPRRAATWLINVYDVFFQLESSVFMFCSEGVFYFITQFTGILCFLHLTDKLTFELTFVLFGGAQL